MPLMCLNNHIRFHNLSYKLKAKVPRDYQKQIYFLHILKELIFDTAILQIYIIIIKEW